MIYKFRANKDKTLNHHIVLRVCDQQSYSGRDHQFNWPLHKTRTRAIFRYARIYHDQPRDQSAAVYARYLLRLISQ